MADDDDPLQGHRGSPRKAGKPSYCLLCGVTWPCLVAKERAAHISHDQWTGREQVRCRQCEREVGIEDFNADQGRCRKCVTDGAALSRYWREHGQPISEREI